jgi:hypothetical protein
VKSAIRGSLVQRRPGVHLYRKLELVQTGIIPKMGLFEDGYENALIMCLEL